MEHLPTVIVCAVLLLIVGSVILGGIRNRKKGKSSCCGSCKGCSMSGGCHKTEE